MPADQIFVLLLVIGIVLTLGWVSWHSRRQEQTPPQTEGDRDSS